MLITCKNTQKIQVEFKCLIVDTHTLSRSALGKVENKTVNLSTQVTILKTILFLYRRYPRRKKEQEVDLTIGILHNLH